MPVGDALSKDTRDGSFAQKKKKPETGHKLTTQAHNREGLGLSIDEQTGTIWAGKLSAC
jgi:hypothetical protein